MNRSEPSIATTLRRSTLFHGMPPTALEKLALATTQVSATRGQPLTKSPGRSGVYLVIKGCLMLSVGNTDTTKVMEIAGPGAHIGLAAAMLGNADSIGAVALSDCALLLVPRIALLACAAEHPQLGMLVACALGRQVQNLVADIESFSLRSGRERVAEYLYQLAGTSANRPRSFMLPAKKSIIASRLSLTPEYFSRVLHDLIESGGIVVNGRQITVLDPVRLRQVEN